ncbi:MAG: type II toxin-antitoxin system Phd/YefM family antitoxin [Candidatus Electrothrix sp. Rat3]|nr:type II toxin-antitoxin system Phd/YefM family antitoxin [Candidatus Electrothrix rattekaaiensis]
MRKITANKFQSDLKRYADQSIANHEPLRVIRKRGKDFVIIGAEDWGQIQETLYILQNTSLMQQIKQSRGTHRNGKDYSPTKEQLDEINSL